MSNYIEDAIGSDETGVGDFFSPLIVVALHIKKNDLNKIKHIPIKDSKMLSDFKIKNIYYEVLPYIKYEYWILNQEKFNKLIKYWNNNEIKMIMHMKVINKLFKKIENIKHIIIDAFSTIKSLEKYRKKIIDSKFFDIEDFDIEPCYEEKAENKYIQVALASIVARFYLLKEMERQKQKWDFNFNLGASDIVDKQARLFIKKFGIDNLKYVAKLNFKATLKKIIND